MILVGNLISDFVKGKKKFDYPAGIQKGITLHRVIDRFTDDHEATREAKQVFRPVYRLYSGAFVDVVYDHFLATDPAEFTESSLFDFSQRVYKELDSNIHWLPERFAGMYGYMKQQNWLYHYRTMIGAQRSLGGVVRRSAYLTDSEPAARLFQQHYPLLQECYRHFWAAVKPFAKEQLQLLLNSNSDNT